jgi:hypothetical protein
MRQLFIDSRDRISGTTCDCTIQLREQLVSTQANFFRIDELRVPLVIPLIQAGINDDIVFALTGAPKNTCILTAGNYSGTDLATMIQSRLAAQFPTKTWTVAYSNATAGLTVTCSDTNFKILNDAECSGLGVATPTFASFLFQNTYTQVAGVTKFSYCPVIAVDQFYLTSQKLSNQDTFGPNGSTDTLMVAPVTSDFAPVMDASMSPDVWLPCPALTTSTLDFQLRNRYYDVLQNVPNISFVLTLR